VRLLLDTHILIWTLSNPARLKPSTRALLEDPSHQVLFSAASVWEMAIKVALGRIDFQVSPEAMIDAALESGFVELPLLSVVALRVAALPLHHGDPFDRLLVAQAMAEPARLVTADAQLEVYSELVMRV